GFADAAGDPEFFLLQFSFGGLVVVPSGLLLRDHHRIVDLSGKREILDPAQAPALSVNGQADGQNDQQTRASGAERFSGSHGFSFRYASIQSACHCELKGCDSSMATD